LALCSFSSFLVEEVELLAPEHTGVAWRMTLAASGEIEGGVTER